jgi:hypothetical protein
MQREAIRKYPNDVDLLREAAWTLATTPNASIRNGADAVEFARRAVAASGGNDTAVLVTLAAAYAEDKQFPEAIRNAEKAEQIAAGKGNRADAERIQGMFDLFKAKQPYRQYLSQ